MNQMIPVIQVILQRMTEDLRQVTTQVNKLGELIAYQAEVIDNLRAENIRLQQSRD